MTSTTLTPIDADERIESIDVLRGVAVLGILALNMRSFANPDCFYMNPTSYGDFTGINYWIWYLTQLLGDLKFWGIFSMLFGAGIVIMSERAEKRGKSAARMHYVRNSWLLLIGLIHAYLIWHGDILYTYAMCGFVVFLFRKRSPRTLIIVGLSLLMVACLIWLLLGVCLNLPGADEFRNDISTSWNPPAETIEDELESMRGSWTEAFSIRKKNSLFFQTFLFLTYFGWRSAGMILIGMALYKMEIFSARRSNEFYIKMLLSGFLIGVPVIAFGIYEIERRNWIAEYGFFFGPLYNFWASILVSLGWVALVMLACKSPAMKTVTKPFANAGRMALSCYLLESIIATTIFYGHGFGLIGKLQIWQQALVCIGIWIFLLVFSTLWLKVYRFGPFEWVWRSLSYWKIQPMLRKQE